MDARRAVDAIWKRESATIVGGLTRLVRDVGLAEELAQDALVAALEQWPATGVPDNPGAWLAAVARRRAVDHVRRAQRGREKYAEIARSADDDGDDEPDGDDALRLMFLSCHPVLPTAERVALTLRLVGGLSTAEIARAFLVDETRIARRVAHAKEALARAEVPFELPAGPELAARLTSVLDVLYLVFNEGYSATSGDDLLRPRLCLEALRLARLLASSAPGEPEVHGLVALLEIQQSRSAARTGPAGEPVQLHRQNRGRWDPLLIRRGFTALLRARELGRPPGPYVLQAAIAACHAQARTAEDTDWPQIVALYDALARILPTPVVALNRAVAVGMARGPGAGLAAVDPLLDDPALADYHLLPAVRGDLLLQLGRADEARGEFERAAALTGNAAEREFLRGRAAGIAPAVAAGPTLATAGAEFLAGLDPATAHSYGQTLRRLERALGAARPVASLTAPEVARVCGTAWGAAAPTTWNRHRAAVRTFGTWAGVPHLADDVARRAGTGTRTAAIPAERLARLWERPGVALRERVLWRLLHESGAGVREVLALDVESLDLDDRRARGVGWRSGTARLLPELVGDRRRGPLFLADRRPARPVAPADLCPETGRRRLSYERAEHLFKLATRDLDPAGEGWTLSRLRVAGTAAPVDPSMRPVRRRGPWTP